MDWLFMRVKATPHAVALMIDEQTWTYQTLNALVEEYCRHLSQLGISSGTFVSILMPNCLEYVCLIHALARLQAVLIPLNTRLTVPELTWQLQHTNCQLLICNDETAGIAKRLPATLYNIQQAPPSLSEPFSILDEPTQNIRKGWQAIVFTSGTTGKPKGVILTYDNHFYSATASAFRLGLDKADCWLSCLPLYHVGGLAVVFRSCLYGTSMNLHNRFDVECVSQCLDNKPITLISLVPTMVYRLLQYRGDRAWSKELRYVLLGGAAASPTLMKQCQALQIPMAPTYGLTEAASQVATMLPAFAQQKVGSVGKPLLFTTVHIVNKEGVRLPPNEYGEVVVSSPTVMQGYYNNELATQQTIQQDQLYTGDIGYLDEEGDLWLVQRRNDIIVTGGENVYPAEVENILCQHPQVKTACVVGVTHPEWGQQVAAMVVPFHTQLTEGVLQQYCRQSLAGYKIPRLIHFAHALPHTASGKVHRQRVAELLGKIET